MVKTQLISQKSVKPLPGGMNEILSILKQTYPSATCSLSYKNPFELLVATILSAQCTDERVNRVTPELFRHFPSPQAMAKADLHEIEKLIQSTGFFRSKAVSIFESSKAIMEKHSGNVPSTLEELIHLRGVGRKTANVVLGNAYGIPGLVVDTHVKRLVRRMGFTCSTDPVKIEQEMMKQVPYADWTEFGHLMISHGRAICTARKVFCQKCPVSSLCPKVGVKK